MEWYVAEKEALEAETEAALVGETASDPRVAALFIHARQLRERADMLLAAMRAETRAATPVIVTVDVEAHDDARRDGHAPRPLLPGDVVRVKNSATPMIVRLITKGHRTVHCAWIDRGVPMLGPFQEPTLERVQDIPPL
ncbi:MAG: hypothetical protein ACJ8GO_10675 [Ramlibacter sp.]